MENDIFYREGILEFLEKNKKVDILILYEKLNGEINLINLIKNIKKINNEINIFFIFENKNLELENLLKNENIKNIFYNDEIDINNFINKLKNAKINNEEKLEEEIKLLKNIINKKDEQLLKYQNSNQYKNDEIFKKKKIIAIIGDECSGKSLIIGNLQNILNDIKNEEANNFEFQEINMNNFYEIKKVNNTIYKFVFIFEINYEKIKLNKEKLDELILNNKINSKKINIIFNKINKYSINKNIAKNIFKEFNIIGKINLNNYCNYLINKNNNYKKENKKLIKQYLKIINKIEK